MTPLSKARLYTCHRDLILLFEAVDKIVPTAILEGHRGKMAQDQAFAAGKSNAKWGQSKHNSIPSLAVDVGPVPLDWNDIQAFERMAVVIKKCAAQLGIKVRWGGDFKSIKDFPHWELVES